ncbi:hypothetical protein AB0L00_38510 [Actinoallomurus sp. NPDC052308]|uniref:hypothetical protein n=1 Tax=Actinoallomurus sp. NPDC052308 TaxID=3155530 RepID=UPI00344147CB
MTETIKIVAVEEHIPLDPVLNAWAAAGADHTGNLAAMARLQRPLIDHYRENFWAAGSGTASDRYLRWTADMVGVERMLYSTDYPYNASPAGGRPANHW